MSQTQYDFDFEYDTGRAIPRDSAGWQEFHNARKSNILKWVKKKGIARSFAQEKKLPFNKASKSLRKELKTTLETEVKSEEDRISATLRAIADQREGTARQEGHIKSLAARVEALGQEIARLVKARSDANERMENAKRDYANYENEISTADSGELGLDTNFESAKVALSNAKKNLEQLRDQERTADKKRHALESKLEALRITSAAQSGANALLSDSRGVNILGSIASLIEVEKGFESAVAAALGSLADAIVVQDLSTAVMAISTLRSQNLGQADVLVASGATSGHSVPNGLTGITNFVKSNQISDLLNEILGQTVFVESTRDAAEVLKSHPEFVVVTRDGDLITKTRARGGSKNSSSLIEIQALISQVSDELNQANHEVERLTFELSNASHAVDNRQTEFDQALARLNDSDARISALTEQLAVASQNAKSAAAEVERLNIAIAEAEGEQNSDNRELEIAKSQVGQTGSITEPDYQTVEALREKLTQARTIEVDARLAVRTSEERVNSIAARALELEQSAAAERAANENAIARRANRILGAELSQLVSQAAYETLIHIERSISKAGSIRSKLEESRTIREGETLTIRQRNRELTQELEQLTSSVHRDEIARAEQRMRIEALSNKAMEEFGVDIQTLKNEYGPHQDVPTFIETEDGLLVGKALRKFLEHRDILSASDSQWILPEGARLLPRHRGAKPVLRHVEQRVHGAPESRPSHWRDARRGVRVARPHRQGAVRGGGHRRACAQDRRHSGAWHGDGARHVAHRAVRRGVRHAGHGRLRPRLRRQVPVPLEPRLRLAAGLPST